MTDPKMIAASCLDVWNENDEAQRRTLIGEGWCDSATYVDPLMRGHGRAAVAAGTDMVRLDRGGWIAEMVGFLDGAPR